MKIIIGLAYSDKQCPNKQKSAGKNLRALKKIKKLSRLTTTSCEYRTFFS
jgi:hypothetical protein